MKKAIVIGATSGIGRQLAILLASQNYVVGITGRRRALLESLSATHPSQFVIADFDVTHTADIDHQLNELVRELGGLELLILSSGIGNLNDTLDFSVEKATVEVNVTGFTAVIDWATNYFIRQQAGHIVGITSIAGLRGGRQAPAYNASKAFQLNYLEGIRQKMTHLKLPVVVTDIRPGFVDTPMAKGEGKFWVAPIEKAAQQMLTAIERRKAVVYITSRWWLIAMLVKFLPRRLYQRM